MAHRYELYGSFNAMPRHVRRTSCRSAVPNPDTTPSLGVSASPFSLSWSLPSSFVGTAATVVCPIFANAVSSFWLACFSLYINIHTDLYTHTYRVYIYHIGCVCVWQCVCEFVQGNVVYLLLGFVSCQQHLKRPNKKRRQQGVKLPDSGRKVASLSLSLSLSLSSTFLSIMLAAGLIIL